MMSEIELYDSSTFGYRHGLAILWFFGAIFKQATRVGLSVAMVDMVKPPIAHVTNTSTVINISTACPQNLLSEIGSSVNWTAAISPTGSPKFEWDSKVQGMLHGAFYYGYIASQIPGAWIAHRFGSTLPVTVGSSVIGLLTILSPLTALHGGMWAFFFARLLVGLCTGLIFPAGMTFWSEWSPPLERARLIGGAGSGSQLGTVLGMFLSGILASSFGWESIFYCFGGLLILWVIPWVILARDSPRLHHRISEGEKAFITTSIGRALVISGKRKRHRIPWIAIFKTMPFYAILVVEWGHNWGFYTMLTNLPTYLNNVQHFSLKKNGILSALPYLVRWGGIVVAVTIADWIRTKNHLSATKTRKLFSCTAFFISSAALVGVGFAGCNSTAAVALLVLTVGAWSLNSGGYFVGYQEMSPEFSGILLAIGNSFGTITGIVAPMVAGVLTSGPNGQTIENWRIVFLISAGMYFFIAVFYLIFGSAKQQPWDPTGKQSPAVSYEKNQEEKGLVQ